MKKIILLMLSFMLLALTAFAQETTATSETTAKKCVPTKECAEKMGMTLEECKAVCQKLCGSKASTSETSVASATAEAELEAAEIEAAEMTLKECAEKMGMTIEECKAKCTGINKTACTKSSTKVAAATATAEVTPNSTKPKAKCCSSKKKCSKK